MFLSFLSISLLSFFSFSLDMVDSCPVRSIINADMYLLERLYALICWSG